MIKYLTNSDVALRVNLNPFAWAYLPFFAYDAPTPIFPKRRTIATGWLFVHLYVDINDGSFKFDGVNLPFIDNEVIDTDGQVDSALSGISSTDKSLV